MILLHVFPLTILRRVRLSANITLVLSLIRVSSHIMPQHMPFDEEAHTTHGAFIWSLF